ncbi:hypothetical protein MKX01_006156 [Papaver californicum]|nr:hypothetical protein MKX01_006156 [Papaver californicum]
MAYYVINYSKLRIWDFEEYNKMMYLDVDIQVFENIDHLFDAAYGYLYTVMDCFCERQWSHSPQYSIGYCQQCPEKVTWPAEMGSPPFYFTTGMFVFEPSRLTYESPIQTLQASILTSFAEQVSFHSIKITLEKWVVQILMVLSMPNLLSGSDPSLLGIELLNEAHSPEVPLGTLLKYYKDGYDIVR